MMHSRWIKPRKITCETDEDLNNKIIQPLIALINVCSTALNVSKDESNDVSKLLQDSEFFIKIIKYIGTSKKDSVLERLAFINNNIQLWLESMTNRWGEDNIYQCRLRPLHNQINLLLNNVKPRAPSTSVSNHRFFSRSFSLGNIPQQQPIQSKQAVERCASSISMVSPQRSGSGSPSPEPIELPDRVMSTSPGVGPSHS